MARQRPTKKEALTAAKKRKSKGTVRKAPSPKRARAKRKQHVV